MAIAVFISRTPARNLTTDLGEIVLNGRPYTSQDLLLSLGTGAANVNTGDSFVHEVVNATVNSVTNYSLTAAIRQENFDVDRFEHTLYSGFANGVTRESVHAFMDEYVVPYIPHRQDLALIESVKRVLSDIFIAHQESLLEEEVRILNSLSEDERETLVKAANEQNQAFFEYLKNQPNLNFNELILTNPDSEQLRLLYSEFIAGYRPPEAYNEANEMLATRFQLSGRNPSNSVGALVIAAITTYGFYASVHNATELKTRYEASGQTLEQFARENPFDVAMLGVDVALTIGPVLKIVGSPRVAAEVLSTARTLGYSTVEEIRAFGEFAQYITKNQRGSIDLLRTRLTSNVTLNVASRNNLFKQLASEAQLAEEGIVIAGGNSAAIFRNAEHAASQCGGVASDYVKKKSSSILTPDGMRIETHWIENISTGQRYEAKTIINM